MPDTAADPTARVADPVDPTPAPPRRRRALGVARGIGAVLLPTALTAVHASLYGRWEVDDAGITFAYARSVASGLGPVLQAGQAPVEGFSDPAWLGVLVLGRWLGLFDHGTWFGVPDYVAYPKTVALLLLAVVFAAFLAIASRVSRYPATVTAVAGCGCALIPSFVIWSVSGLENALLAAAVAGQAAVIVRAGEPRIGAAVVCGLLAAVAALTRPEGLVYAATFPLALLVVGRLRWRSLGAAALSVVAFAVPYGAYLAWRRAEFGQWLPTPAVAKAQGLPTVAGFAKVGQLVSYAGWPAVLLGAVVVGAALARRPAVGHPAVAPAVDPAATYGAHAAAVDRGAHTAAVDRGVHAAAVADDVPAAPVDRDARAAAVNISTHAAAVDHDVRAAAVVRDVHATVADHDAPTEVAGWGAHAAVVDDEASAGRPEVTARAGAPPAPRSPGDHRITIRGAVAVVLVPLALALVAFGVLIPDWMSQYRFATPVWTLAPLVVALAGAEVLATLRWRGRTLLAVGAVAALAISVAGFVPDVRTFRVDPVAPMCLIVTNTGREFNGYLDVLHLDTGAFFAPEIGGAALTGRARLVDGGGLAEPTIARAWAAQDPAAIRDYVLDVVHPAFVRAHGSFRPFIGLDADPRFQRDYVEIDAIPNNGANWVRRDLVPDAATMDRLKAWAVTALAADATQRATPLASCGDRLLVGPTS